ncbi:uncharacterized protein DUF222 [Kribbella antiqua]|uniref:Uncharacterized protein DUF222 n=1 Tax=Kribbella antiqua TaxID=2512217 RepID=A0A4V2S3L9_9ACTN|nr:DUF222 domain-containing protein [Kribbella antiqua]TCO44970.1 uncharacterized protein DUF222 [Kribbella antiqua]
MTGLVTIQPGGGHPVPAGTVAPTSCAPALSGSSHPICCAHCTAWPPGPPDYIPDDLPDPIDHDLSVDPESVPEPDDWDVELDAPVATTRSSRVDDLDWQEWHGVEQDEADRALLALDAPAWLSLPPGGALAAALEDTRPRAMSPIALMELMKATTRMVAWAESIKAEAMASFYRHRRAEHTESPRPTQLDTRGRPIDPDRSWHAELALALGLSPTTVARHVTTALRLTSTLRATHTALKCGTLTWGKALAISEATTNLPDEAAQAVEAHVLKRAPTQTHRNLLESLRRQVAKHTTRQDAEDHRAAVADRTCKIVPLPNGMAGLWIVHTADKIQQIWVTIQAIAALAKRGTPTGAPTNDAPTNDSATSAATNGPAAGQPAANTNATGSPTTGDTTTSSPTGDNATGAPATTGPATYNPATVDPATTNTSRNNAATTQRNTTSDRLSTTATVGTPPTDATNATAPAESKPTPAPTAAAADPLTADTNSGTADTTTGTITDDQGDGATHHAPPTTQHRDDLTGGPVNDTGAAEQPRPGSSAEQVAHHHATNPAPATRTAEQSGTDTTAVPVKDTRTAEQRRADVTADLFEHILRNGLDWLGRRLPDQHRRRPHIEVIIPASTLLGLDDDPAELTGYGPIPAEMARRIATDGTWRRLLTDPLNGIVLEASTTRHDPGTLVTETLLARHPVCAWPGCNRTSRDCDRDHTTPFTQTGTTTLTGLAPYCEYHHVIKDTPTWGWTTTSHPDGSITLTTPTGHRHTTVPPARGPITTRGPITEPPDAAGTTSACVGRNRHDADVAWAAESDDPRSLPTSQPIATLRREASQHPPPF